MVAVMLAVVVVVAVVVVMAQSGAFGNAMLLYQYKGAVFSFHFGRCYKGNSPDVAHRPDSVAGDIFLVIAPRR